MTIRTIVHKTVQVVALGAVLAFIAGGPAARADDCDDEQDEIKKLADHKREDQVAQAKLFTANAFKLSDDPTLGGGPPTKLKVVPFFNLSPIENAVTRLKLSAKAYDEALAAKGAALPPATKAKLVELAGRTEQPGPLAGAVRIG